ncbi:DEDD exonuclease domain-containing protein [Nocardiopsis sp. RSe5-2]|uniref:DEDD exonuclease domain-containing protein n=1 Tax=Nocardiopsis endophytica TaxID=3018445 RepID=A0ABT4UCF9_9ACTN|nr:DEDD exonuclease domain-containing protein [Nocardiopsis endophytica]MDA2814159.1 DEDD exonuclease domain-containing protein [Nocardiopsis endophytica]
MPQPADRAAAPVQETLDDLGTPLAEGTFVVVDLETTGGRAGGSAITEIGAVKVRGGRTVGEFSSLVDPGSPIPAHITLLTGITQAMVATAPPIEAVLPAFLEFANLEGDTVLVAHNAPFDVSFLKAACAEQDRPWPRPRVVDTLPLARRLVTREEVRNHKLGTLARFFAVPDRPVHRALDDARATAGVLHGLLERLGPMGVHSVEELCAFRTAPTRAQRGKRHLAEGVPEGPGVYVFTDARGEPLYVGKSTSLRKRVRSYFTAAETRGRVREMIGVVEAVTPIPCATGLEAEVREMRLIAERKPPYNRRSRNPERASWLKLTPEAFPRLSKVRTVRDDGAPYLGPFTSAREAELAREALLDAFPLRQCTRRIGPRGDAGPACVLAQMGRCGAPCTGEETLEEYAEHAGAAREAMVGDPEEVVRALRGSIADLAAGLRYEEAAERRDRLAAFLRGAARSQRLSALTGIGELVAARPLAGAPGSWEVHVVRRGRLAAAAVMEPGADPHAFVAALTATAETVAAGPGPAPAAAPQETECVLRWLESPGVRLVDLDAPWTCPARGAERHRELTDWAREASEAAAEPS